MGIPLLVSIKESSIYFLEVNRYGSKNQAAQDGRKEVLTIEVEENESSKYWLFVLSSFKNRRVKDILMICADGLTGIKEAITAAYPKTEYRVVSCIRSEIQ